MMRLLRPARDILRSRFPWITRQTDGWTDEDFRNDIRRRLNDFLEGHSWADLWKVTEKFEGSQDINRTRLDENALPTRGPDNLPYPPGTRQSNNTPILILEVRKRDPQLFFECGVQFPNGVETLTESKDSMFDHVFRSFEAQEMRSR